MQRMREPGRDVVAAGDTAMIEPRKHICPCGRYLGESRAHGGYILVKCPSCGAWRKLDLTPPEHVQSA